MMLRPLHANDLPNLMALKAAASWNQTEEDWLRVLRLAPEGCFGIEDDGRVVATATVVCYGNDLAWIGMVLTLPEYRGRGLARRLMNAVLDVSGSRVVRLDASDFGKPLYERLGFVDECAVERWLRQPAPLTTDIEVEDLRCDFELDREAFGADRSNLLHDLEHGASLGSGYAYFRPGALAEFFGPCVARDHQDAMGLLRWWTSRFGPQRALAVDVFPHDRRVTDAASAIGFVPFRRLTRMVRQPSKPEMPDPRVAAIAGFEWG